MTRAHKRNLFIAYLFLFIVNIIIIFFTKVFFVRLNLQRKITKK